MSNQNHPEPADPWAVVKRIQEARKQGWRPDYAKMRARIDAQAAARHATRLAETARAAQLPAPVERIVQEALLRRRIDQAVREVLARPEAAESLQQTVSEGASGKALHEMTADEFRAHARETWAPRLPSRRRPMTIGEWVAGRYEGDGEA